MSHNIVLIGLPGCGKSTLGVQLAKTMGYAFLDTDISIQSAIGQTLQSLLDEQGYLALRKVEEDVLLNLNLNHTVIATGGSAVYSTKAMEHLAQQGLIVYLQVTPATILKRITNAATRGIARAPEQSLDDVIAERLPLYERYANITIDNEDSIDIDSIAKQLRV